MGKEQRRDKRTPVSEGPTPLVLPIFYQLLTADGAALDNEIRAAFTQDLSPKGLCLEIHHLPPALRAHLLPKPTEGLRMELDLTLPPKRLRLNTRVAWVKPLPTESSVQVGVQFLNLPESVGAELATFAEQLSRRPKIRRLVLAGLSALSLIAGGALLWSTLSHREERETMSRAIEMLEEEKLPDGTCAHSFRCGELKCCTWTQGVCVCDSCCVK